MTLRRAPECNSSSDDMAEQPVNLSTVIYLGVFSRAEQRVLQVIFKEIAEGGGQLCRYARNDRAGLKYQQINHTQCNRPSSRHRPSGKDGTPLLLRSITSQHSELRASALAP
jgi:hypothetical protein